MTIHYHIEQLNLPYGISSHTEREILCLVECLLNGTDIRKQDYSSYALEIAHNIIMQINRSETI